MNFYWVMRVLDGKLAGWAIHARNAIQMRQSLRRHYDLSVGTWRVFKMIKKGWQEVKL